jgi:hypothetical protein
MRAVPPAFIVALSVLVPQTAIGCGIIGCILEEIDKGGSGVGHALDSPNGKIVGPNRLNPCEEPKPPPIRLETRGLTPPKPWPTPCE